LILHGGIIAWLALDVALQTVTKTMKIAGTKPNSVSLSLHGG
jgi:hypothetical protein